MICRMNELKNKYVINVRNGSRLGYVADAEFDTVTAGVAALVIKGKWRFFGLLGREDDIILRWSDIEVIGEDTILVNLSEPPKPSSKRGSGLFRILTED